RHWRNYLPGAAPADYDDLIRRLAKERRAAEADHPVNRGLIAYLDQGGVFTLPLAERLIDSTGDPIVPRVCTAAAACLEQHVASAAAWSSSSALIADFGEPGQQRRLVELLADSQLPQTSPARFDALVAGVANRYTPNRVAFLRPLLEQEAYHLAA